MRLALILTLLPALATASNDFNRVEVTPENAEKLGFIVSVAPTKRHTRIRITYPTEIGGVWIADQASILYRKGSSRSVFISSNDFGPDHDEPIIFQFDEQSGDYDATVIIYYKCDAIGDDECDGFESKMYYIYSVLSHFKPNGL